MKNTFSFYQKSSFSSRDIQFFYFPLSLSFPYGSQERSESTSSVAFEVLIINCEIDFINLFVFNCLTSNFCFPENTTLANRRKRLFMDARPYFRILNSSWKMVMFGLLLLTFFRSLTDGYCFYNAI